MTNTPGPDWLPTEWLRLLTDRPPGEIPRNVILRKWVHHDGTAGWFPFEVDA